MNPADIRIETDRLLMRPPIRADFDAWAAIATDAENMRHLGGVQPRPAAWRHFAFAVGSWHLQGFGVWVMRDRERGELVGVCGFWQAPGWRRELTWWLLPRYRSRGFAPTT